MNDEKENVTEVVNKLGSIIYSGSIVSFTAATSGNVGASTGGSYSGTANTTVPVTEYYGYTYPYAQQPWWPLNWSCTYTDKQTTAFRVAKALHEKKTVELASVQEFISLVDEILAAL